MFCTRILLLILIVQVSGEHNNLTINSSDRVASIALPVYTQVLPPSAHAYLCMYRSKQTSEHANLAVISDERCSRARLRMRCVVALYRPMPDPSVGWASYKLDKQVNSSDRATSDRAARACTSSFAFTRMSSCVCEPTLTSSSRTPAEEKTFVGKKRLGWRPRQPM